MSAYATTAVFRHSQSTGSDRLVLLVIADRSDDDGTGCYRGKESMAKMARLSRATVTRSITHLVDLGELEVTARDGSTNLYRVVLPGLDPAQSEPPPPAQSEPPPRLTGEPPPGSLLSRETSLSHPSTIEQRANALAREWWENYQRDHSGRDPMQPFPAARKVITNALKAKWTDAQVRTAITRCTVPLSQFNLGKALERVGTSGAPDFDHQSRRRGIG